MLVLSSPNAFVEWEVSTAVKFASGTSVGTAGRQANAANVDRNLYQTGAAYHQYVPCFGQGAQVNFLHVYSVAAGASVDQYGLEYAPATDDARMVRAIFYPGQLEAPRSVLGIGCSAGGFPAQVGALTTTATRFYPPGNRGMFNINLQDGSSGQVNYSIRVPPMPYVLGSIRLPQAVLRVPPWGLVDVAAHTGTEEAAVSWQSEGTSALYKVL